MFKRYLLGVSAVFAIAFFPGIIGIGVDSAEATTITVCSSGCNQTTISSALVAANPSDVINVKTGYNGSGDGNLSVADSSLTISCDNTDVVIGSATVPYALTYSGGATALTVQSCTFRNFSVLLATSSVATNNIFTRSTTTLLATIDGDGVQLTNNSFVDANANLSDDSFLVKVNAGSDNFDISGNSFTEDSGLTEKYGYSVVLVDGNTSGEIHNNYFTQSVSNMAHNNGGAVVVGQGSTEGSTVVLDVSHNTFKMATSTALSVSDGADNESLSVTSTYNIFYNAGTPNASNNVLIGIYCYKNNSGSSLSIYEDYNSYYYFQNNYSTEGVAAGIVTAGGHSIDDVEPYFKIGDVSTSNDAQLVSFSKHLDFNGSLDIGADNVARGSEFFADDNGTVNYTTVHATNTVWMAGNLRTDDIVNFAAGTYDAFSLSSSTVLTGGLTFKGHDPDSTYLATQSPYDYNGNSYNQISPQSGGGEGIYFMYGNGGQYLTAVTSTNVDISSIVSSTPQDWHLALISSSTSHFTVYHRADIFANQAAAQPFWTGLGGYGIDFWATSTFDYDVDSDSYLYVEPSGPTPTTTYQSGDPAINTNNATSDSIINVTGVMDGISLTGLNNNTIQNLIIKNASSTEAVYTVSNHPFYNGVTSYNQKIGGGSGGFYLVTACSQEGIVWVSSADTDISSIVGSTPQDWHLGLISTSTDGYYTAYHRNDAFANQAEAENCWSNPYVGGYTIDYWSTSTFAYTGGQYIYTAPAGGPVPITTYQSGDPAITKAVTRAGIKLINSNSNLISAVSLSDNTYGVWFTGSSRYNIVSSTSISDSVTYDVYGQSTVDNDFKNVTFDRTSTNMASTGDIYVYFKARARVTNASSTALSGVSTSFGDNLNMIVITSTTDSNGYTPYSDYLVAYRMDSSSVALTNGNYNPYVVSAEAISGYSATSTTSTLSSPNQTFTLVMAEFATPAVVTLSTTTLAVTEGSTTSTYTIVLDSQPTNDVVITLSTTSSADISFSTSTLTFTSANYATPQTVVVTATNDDLDETTETAYITHTASSSDTNYNNISISTSTVTITDNDAVAVTLSETTATVTEGSTTDTYTVVLGSQPTASVVVTPAVTGAKVAVSPTSLTFTTSTWATPQTITITAVDDSSVESTHTDTVTHTASSSDSNYNEISVSTVNVTITDNDVASSGGGGGRSTTYSLIEINTTTPTSTSPATTTVPDVVSTSTVSQVVTTTPPSDVKPIIISPVFKFTKTLKFGMSDTEVSELQKVLKGLKYFTYPSITKYFGSITKAALIAYQKANGLATNGVTDELTRNSLNGLKTTGAVSQNSINYKFTKFLYVGSIGTEVKQLQLKLTELGYYNGPISSYFGSLTRAAVIKLQKENKLTPAMGWTGPGTRAILNK